TRACLPRGWVAAGIDLERALALLSLPREVGRHPESGKPMTAGIGRYGPFVHHDGTFANLESVDEVFSVGLNRAVSLIAEKLAGGRRGRGAPKALRTLGEHPEGGAVTLRDGRYGAYVNHGKLNATLPKAIDVEALTLETALELLAAKAGKRRPRRGGPPKSAAGSRRKTGARSKRAAEAS
ncbi:MAG: topoisomerase C-terminal repeat-containing protein, partial [Bauldia sp.]